MTTRNLTPVRLVALVAVLAAPLAGQMPAVVDLDSAARWTWGAKPGYSLDVEDACEGSDFGCAVIRSGGSPSVGFAYLSRTVDAEALRGRRVRFSASLRLEAIGQVGLFMRVDRPAGVGFEEHSLSKRLPQREWVGQEIVGAIDEDAVAVTFGVRFSGRGAAYLADPQVLEIRE